MGNCGVENPLSGRPCMRERPESLRYFDLPVQVKILEDWVIRRKPVHKTGILRDYTGRDCDVQDIVQPATPALTGGQGKPDAGC